MGPTPKPHIECLILHPLNINRQNRIGKTAEPTKLFYETYHFYDVLIGFAALIEGHRDRPGVSFHFSYDIEENPQTQIFLKNALRSWVQRGAVTYQELYRSTAFRIATQEWRTDNGIEFTVHGLSPAESLLFIYYLFQNFPEGMG